MMSELEEKIEKIYLMRHKEKTYKHVCAVANCACQLAKLYHEDIKKVKYASLLHDISVILSPDDMYKMARERDMNLDQAEEAYHFLLHQRISKIIVKDDLGIDDEDILLAIECHTTLKKDANNIDKIVFLADKLACDQESKPPYFDIVQHSLSISLDKGCYEFMKYQLAHHLLLMPHHWFMEAFQQLERRI